MSNLILTTPTELEALIQNSVRKAIAENMPIQPGVQNDLMTLSEAANYLQLSKQTIYGYTSSREIPHLKKGKRLRFRKSDLDKWLSEGRQFTRNEILEKDFSDLKGRGGKK